MSANNDLNGNRPDSAIARGMAEGCRDAYNEFVRRFSGYIYRECLCFCPDIEEARDLLNEILIRIVISIGSYNPAISGLNTWVTAVARNYLIDYSRRMKEEPEIIAFEDSYFDLFPSYVQQEYEECDAEGLADASNPDIDRFRHALRKIKGRNRAIIELRADGQSYESIGKFLGISPRAAMMAFSRAVKRVKKLYYGEMEILRNNEGGTS